ncbi:MAG: c-type cytochrome [Caulobacteraceae bacterium]
MGPKAYASVLILALTAGAAQAQAIDPNLAPGGDAVHGEVLFKQRCSVCHQPDPGGKNGVGPALYGAFGRRAGQAPGFAYSDNLKASGVVWTPEKLNQWIQKPATLVPGVKMVLAPISQPKDRADIIAFLRTKTTTPGAAPKAPSPHDLHEQREHEARHKARAPKS